MTDDAIITYWSLPSKNDAPLWQAYTPDMSDAMAIEEFQKKYGYVPEAQKRYASVLLVGPIFEEA